MGLVAGTALVEAVRATGEARGFVRRIEVGVEDVERGVWRVAEMETGEACEGAGRVSGRGRRAAVRAAPRERSLVGREGRDRLR